VTIEFVKPEDIERRSMEIITSELGRSFPEPEFSVVKRCIHTSADFDYAETLRVSEDAVQIGIRALRDGANVVTDTKMAAAGINKTRIGGYGGQVHCFISDEDVMRDAKARGCTRATVSMEKASKLDGDLIFAIGNAPTALVELYKLIEQGLVSPKLIVGAPVGFVNVVESKELIMSAGIPYIVPVGRKGGSNIAATIINSMLYYKGEI
jgi:precorrin-8X/cobalt-precorrin-8 methylmutase